MMAGKTNAIRILDSKRITYKMMEYENKDGKIDGVSVAAKIGKDPKMVYKTLVTQNTHSHYVFVIPVDEELDLKKAAKAAGEKKLDMLPVKDIQKFTGYIRGGCSPIGMKKLFPTFIDQQATDLNTIIVSGGRIGIQIELDVEDLRKVVNASLIDLVK
ncbi:Cys-tRNA(Pro) deacylase [Bacillus sp. M6-12]|uniref:Cys-tRNA(Pro) deacylase n=1 Tax=Bacillus sp. M6-12 TaxID=2054166 RepID=UPI000C7905F8|nr:Cys-tRNA(Pro) deacylase [Bacillus sp. M6-12]PLS18414.1 Cys-tRNA(Pro) deacylase [Bacillus sp. M6-12]